MISRWRLYRSYRSVGSDGEYKSQRDGDIQQRSRNVDKPPLRYQPGWRPSVLAWAGVISCVMLANIILLVYAKRRPVPAQPPAAEVVTSSIERRNLDGGFGQGNDDTILLYEGNCNHVSTVKGWSHVVINILSTLLLTASAICMQCLSAPTREDIQRAHSRGRHLDVGFLSARNIIKAPLKRSIPWLVLAISSMPLHFFYNSIIFSSLASNDVLTFVASQEYANSSTFNSAFLDQGGFSLNPISEVQPYDWNYNRTYITATAQSLRSIGEGSPNVRLELDDCIKEFQTPLVSKYKSLALVTFVSNKSQILDFYTIQEAGYSQPWTCYDASQYYKNTNDLMRDCDPHSFRLLETVISYTKSGAPLTHPGILDYCIAETVPETCSLQLAPYLLITVIVANFVKLATLLYTAIFLSFHPIVTIGDAIAVLGRPAHKKENNFVLADSPYHAPSSFRRSYPASWSRITSWNWRTSRLRWFYSVSISRWAFSIGMCLCTEFVGGFLLGLAIGRDGLSESEAAGFGAVSGTYIFGVAGSIVSVSLLANLPQMIVSLVYVLYYVLISSMILVAETSNFAVRRETVRVSPPRAGQQKSTYWLTLPYRYAIPLMISTTVLHWFISQSIFLVRIDQVLSSGWIYYASINGCGYSPTAIVASMAWGGVMILAPFLLAFRRLPKGIPILRGNSLHIAAACLPDPLEPEDGIEKPIQFGVLPSTSAYGIQRVGFSSRFVAPIEEGNEYIWPRGDVRIMNITKANAHKNSPVDLV